MNKPAYRVPTMQEVADTPWNGLRVVSTFSGCGGSCTGYRMAGLRVAWANEFVPIAQESYRANMAKGSILDGRDIREVTGAEILAATGLGIGDIDILDGSPPCQAFSTAGKRAKGWGQEKVYEHGAKQQNELLFWEYIRLVKELKPKVFIAENVSGLVKGTAKGMFLEILKDLRACGYTVATRLLDAQWLGVPQTRQRLIFIGVREDLCKEPVFPKPLPYRYSVRDACPWMVATGGISGTGFGSDKSRGAEEPVQTIMAEGGGGMNSSQFGCVVLDTGGQYDLRIKGFDDPVMTITCSNHNHIRAVAPPVEPEAWMDGTAAGEEWESVRPGGKSEKYFQLVKPHPDSPVGTVTASGGVAGAALVCHPYEKRKFSIAELKRLCAFPDDYALSGSYRQQWERLGNSVPPVMMFHIAKAVATGIFGVDHGD